MAPDLQIWRRCPAQILPHHLEKLKKLVPTLN